MEVDDDLIEAVEGLLNASDHKPDCPNVGDMDIDDCPCGYAGHRSRVVNLIAKAKAHVEADAGMDF